MAQENWTRDLRKRCWLVTSQNRSTMEFWLFTKFCQRKYKTAKAMCDIVKFENVIQNSKGVKVQNTRLFKPLVLPWAVQTSQSHALASSIYQRVPDQGQFYVSGPAKVDADYSSKRQHSHNTKGYCLEYPNILLRSEPNWPAQNMSLVCGPCW